MAARVYGRKGVWAGPELSTGRKASGGKTLDFDAGFTPCFLPSNSCLGYATTAAAARESERSVFKLAPGFWESCQRDCSDFAAICGGRRRRRSPSITAPTGRRPLHRGGRATHPRAPIGFILHALECRRFATAQARSQRRPARVLRLPPYVASHRGGRAGQPRAPTRAHASFARTSAMARTRATRHACCRSRGRRGPVGSPGSRVAARVALEGLKAAPLDTL